MSQQQYNYAGQQPYQQSGYYPQNANPYTGVPPIQTGYIPPPPMPRSMPGTDAYVESGAGEVKSNFGFNNSSIRIAFIRKVFFLVSIMLTVITIMTAIPFLHADMRQFVRTTPSLYWISYVTFFIVYLTLMCCESVRRSFPINLVGTGILTLAIGYMTMMITSYHDLVSVLLCLAITTVCCVGIIIFASQTKYDLTSMIGFMFIISMVLFVFGIIAVIAAVAFKVRWLYTVYAGIAALVFMVYLAMDIQMIMGGKKYEISPEDYIFAAIQIFMDIVYIFWMLLSLFGSNKN